MIHFQLYTLSGQKFDDDVYEVILPTLDGQIGVLPGHMPLVSVATIGVISVRRNQRDSDAQMDHFATFGGIIDVNKDNLRVLVDEADNSDEINEAEAQHAIERAKKMMAEAKDQTSLEQAQTLIDRQTVRLQVAQLSRRSTRR
jgi:F-type H+-transporting ATPase subunit epsilon